MEGKAQLKKLRQKMILGSTTIFGLKAIGLMCPSYTLPGPVVVCGHV